MQDKPIGSPFADFYADLNEFSVDDTLPLDPQGYGSDVWFENYLDACGVYYERGPIRAFPYDCAVSCTFYRQDLFEKLTKDFEADYGYRLEFTDETTYKDMVDIAEFFRKMHERDSSIPYGYAQHHGSFGWTTQLDIQRHMYAQNQWLDFAVDDTLGSKNPGPTNWGDAQSVKAMEGYKALADVSHPDNLTNGTLELNTVYAAGGVAMQIQYHEFAASVEDPEQSVAAGGKTGYAMGPKGAVEWNVDGGDNVVNATNCGIGGIGINAGADMDLQRAAFIFASWACSHDTQLMVLRGVGGTPTRKSVLDVPEVRRRATGRPPCRTRSPSRRSTTKASARPTWCSGRSCRSRTSITRSFASARSSASPASCRLRRRASPSGTSWTPSTTSKRVPRCSGGAGAPAPLGRSAAFDRHRRRKAAGADTARRLSAWPTSRTWMSRAASCAVCGRSITCRKDSTAGRRAITCCG